MKLKGWEIGLIVLVLVGGIYYWWASSAVPATGTSSAGTALGLGTTTSGGGSAIGSGGGPALPSGGGVTVGVAPTAAMLGHPIITMATPQVTNPQNITSPQNFLTNLFKRTNVTANSAPIQQLIAGDSYISASSVPEARPNASGVSTPAGYHAAPQTQPVTSALITTGIVHGSTIVSPGGVKA